MKRILIFGGSGFVGGNLARRARERWEVIVFGHTKQGRQIDITSRREVFSALAEFKPEVVINAAAISNIDFAEKNQDLARAVNVYGAENIALGCKDSEAKYIFFSSGAVFAGTADSYDEEDPTDPVNFYGKTKAEAESKVLASDSNSLVIRISLVLGYPVSGGNAFYRSLEERLHREEEVAVPVQEIRTPVDVYTLCEAVLELADSDYTGIIHIGSTEPISRYDLTGKVTRAMGYDPKLIKPAKTEELAGRAPRHRRGILDVKLAQRLLHTPMLGVDEGIRRSIAEKS